jgi:hypothetical protein
MLSISLILGDFENYREGVLLKSTEKERNCKKTWLQ